MLQQLLNVEALVTSSALVNVVEVEVEVASDAGEQKLTYMRLHVCFQVVTGDESFTTHTANIVKLVRN